MTKSGRASSYAIRAAYDHAATTIGASSSLDKAFTDASDLRGALEALVGEAATLRARIAYRIYTGGGRMTLAVLGTRLGVSKARADQIIRAAKALPRQRRPIGWLPVAGAATEASVSARVVRPESRQDVSTMDEKQERDEFQRMRLTQEIERARYLMRQYDDHQAFWQDEIETKLYKLGQLDERLGGQTSDD